jgi:hypothetical protein
MAVTISYPPLYFILGTAMTQPANQTPYAVDDSVSDRQQQGDRFNNDPDMVYGDDSELNPIRRAGSGTNPDPCYILNILVLDPENGSDFQVAWDYLDALPTKDYSDPTFPAPYAP